jgi:hypothetical protein
VESGVRGRNAGVNRALQQHLANLVLRHAVVEGCADMQLELVGAIERDHQPDRQQAARVSGQARARPDLAPSIAGDQCLKLTVEIVALRQRALDVGIAEHRLAYFETLLESLVFVHFATPSGR